MNSRASERFWELFEDLPADVRLQARESFKRFSHDPFHRGLQFKHVSLREPLWSARISRNYRALGIRDDEQITWIWLGTHAEYDHFLKRLR